MRIRRHLSYANVMSTIAVIAALGGPTAVAVTVSASKKSDINKKGNIRAGRVTTPKLATGAVINTKLAGVEIVQASGPGNITAACPGGTRLMGGGGGIAGGGSLTNSGPAEGVNGWRANSNTGTGVTTAYALCLR